jgi:hypothetical protein
MAERLSKDTAGRSQSARGSKVATLFSTGALPLVIALYLVPTSPARTDSCDSACEDPDSVEACLSGDPVWGLQQPDGQCRAGSHGYLDSLEAAETERHSLARLEKRSCDRGGSCVLFEQLDGAEPVCLACDRAYRLTQILQSLSPAAETQRVTESTSGPGPELTRPGRTAEPELPDPPPTGTADTPQHLPCRRGHWQQTAHPGRVERCYDRFTALPQAYSRGARCTSGDCQNGQGSYLWPDGQRYAGAFRGGQRHGQGTFSWPDGRKYIGGWLRGEPGGLGTRIHADGSFLIGYFENGGYLGDSEHYGQRFAGEKPEHSSAEISPDGAGPSDPAPAPVAEEESPSCDRQCNELAELELNRIADEYECCYARHAFCIQKAQIEARSCDTQGCLDEQAAHREECDLRYACDEVRSSKQVGFRERNLACLKSCTAEELDEQGLEVSERGTLYTK